MEKRSAYLSLHGECTDEHLKDTILMILRGYSHTDLNRGQVFAKIPYRVSFDMYQRTVAELKENDEIIIASSNNKEDSNLLSDIITIKTKNTKIFRSFLSSIARWLQLLRS